MNKVYLALGSNLGDKSSNIRLAIENIRKEIGNVEAISSIYETEPVGFVSENMFANAACLVYTDLSALALLQKTQEIERDMGRLSKSTNEEYIDRIIDIDILMYNVDIIELPQLKLPHPHMHQRDFVLYPLAEIAADVIHPILKKTFGELKDKKSNTDF